MKEDAKGLYLKGQLNMKVQRAREAHALLEAGDIDGLSIGYDLLGYEKDSKDESVWHLTKIRLREVSIVTEPANDNATVDAVKSAKRIEELKYRFGAGDRLTERELETLLKGALGFSNSQAERAVRSSLKGSGEPTKAADDDAKAFLMALRA